MIPGTMTNMIHDDLKTMFIIRTWYSGRYIDSLTDDEQDGIDHMLDGYDKLSDIMGDENSIMMRYEFLLDADTLLNCYGDLLEMSLDAWKEKHKSLTLVKLNNERSYIEIIAEQMESISKK
jgi:hypothetical protein